MGMYSTPRDWSVLVTDAEGLMGFLADEQVPSYIPVSISSDYREYKEFWLEKLRGEDVSSGIALPQVEELFYGKIIQYWYEGYCAFMRDVAQFLMGYVELEFETQEESARIHFKDKRCSVEFGELVWKDGGEIGSLRDLSPLPDSEKAIRGL